MHKQLFNNRDIIIEISDMGISIPVGGSYIIPSADYSKWSSSNNTMLLIAKEDLKIHNGDSFLDSSEGISLLIGKVTSSMSIDPVLIENNTIKISSNARPHAEAHIKGGVDEINLNGLSGVLSDNQHPIPSEVISALGPKSNTNPYNHDRFQQSEIISLPESQLNLNHATHSNANDLTINEKEAISASVNPNSSNPFITASQQIPGIQGPKGDKGDQGNVGPQGPQGTQGVKGDKGDKGDRGDDFVIYKTYETIQDMNFDFTNVPLGTFVMIDTGNVEDIDNGKLYYRNLTQFDYIADLSGASGIQGPKGDKGDTGDIGPQGPQGTQGIQGIQGEVGPKGDKGDKGDAGTSKRSKTLSLRYTGSTTGSSWLFSETISTYLTPVVIPFNARIKTIIFSNRNGGTTSNPIRMELDIYTSLFDDYNLQYIQSLGSNMNNMIQSNPNGRYYLYNAENDNSILYQNRVYGFQVYYLSGSTSMRDVRIEVELEEI